jgi:DNA-binding transcriptional MerR regulator
MSEQPELSVAQIAEALADKRPPTEIANTIAAHWPSIDMAELAELLNRAKELQAQAEEFQHKASMLMDVIEKIVKASPDLDPLAPRRPEQRR